MVTVAASVLDSYPDTTEVVTRFQCETQPHKVPFKLTWDHIPQTLLWEKWIEESHHIMQKSHLLKQQEVCGLCDTSPVTFFAVQSGIKILMIWDRVEKRKDNFYFHIQNLPFP